MKKKTSIYGTLKTATWIAGLIFVVLFCYVRWGMPHGPMINTGEWCGEVNYRGDTACSDRYVEDTRGLNIPDWAKFLRDEPSGIILGFIILAVFFEYKLKDDEDTWPHLRN